MSTEFGVSGVAHGQVVLPEAEDHEPEEEEDEDE